MTCKNPQIDELFLAAAEFHPPNAPAQLDKICGDDADLRERLEQLLRAQSRVESLLDLRPGIGCSSVAIV